jgi:hypothetical protein
VLGFIHLIERTELVEEAVVTVCISVNRAEIVGKMIQEQREKENERGRRPVTRGEY